MILRDAALADLGAVEQIERLSESNPWSYSMFESELARNDSRFWVLEQKKEILGFAVYRILEGEAELLSIALHSDIRRKGWGLRMLEETIGELKKEGVQLLQLEVRSGNVAARKLYEKFGFLEDGKRTNYYENPREDAVLMTCHL